MVATSDAVEVPPAKVAQVLEEHIEVHPDDHLEEHTRRTDLDPNASPAEREAALTKRGKREAAKATAEAQRAINTTWENTQRFIAVAVTVVSMAVAVFIVVMATMANPTADPGPAFIFLVGAANLVVGFYFGRTNHTRSSGGGDPEATR